MRRRRPANPVAYLKTVIVTGMAGLAILPSIGDVINGVARPVVSDNSCRILQVIDGDTVRLWCAQTGSQRARIMGLDTPELFRPSCPSELTRAYQAKWQLRWLIWNANETKITRQGQDRYGRVLIKLMVNDANIAQKMIDTGHARRYSGGQRQSWCEA